MDELSILNQIKASLNTDNPIELINQDNSTGDENVSELTEQIVESKEVKQPEDKFSKKYAELTKKEKAIAERESKIGEQLALYKEVEELINSKNPEKLLSKLGLGVEDFLSILAGVEVKSTEENIDPVQKELNEIKSKLKAQEDEKALKLKEQEDAQLKQSEKVLNDFKKDVEDFVKNNQDDYEGIAQHASSEDVLELVKHVYVNDGKLLTMKEACDLLENQIIETARKFTGMKKLSGNQSIQQSNKSANKTLSSNTMNPISVDSKKQLSDAEQERITLEKIKQAFGG